MRVWLIARKTLLELLREWQLLLLVVAVPVAFLGILAAGYSTPLLVTHTLLVANSDPRAEPLLEELAAQRYADGRPVFDIRETDDLDAAEAALRDQSATALILISLDDNEDAIHITLRGNALYTRFYRASTILESVAARHADRMAGRPEIVQVVQQVLGGASPRSEFDLYAPGMIIFALMLIVPQTAMLVAREVRCHTLGRLRLTPVRAWDLLGGISLAQMVVAVFQVVVVFITALLIGFQNQGSLLTAVLVGLAVSFPAIGQGLLVACFVENDSQAINVGSAVAMMQVWFSGSFYRLPPMTVFALAGHQIDLFDVFPATHGLLALQQVLSYGVGLEEIAFRLGATLVLSLLYFGLGVAVFQRLKMRDREGHIVAGQPDGAPAL
jgi:ABC-2 type transport system permease protein